MGVPAPRNKLQAWLTDPIGQVTGPIGDNLGAAYNQLASYPSIGAAMDAANQWGSNAAQQMQAPMYDRTSGGLTPKGQEYANLLAGFTGTSLAGKAPGITAFHGSPHSFDKFSTSAIGTGEGAQAYGHGLYFAGEEGVARSYRDQLSGRAYHYDGQPLASVNATGEATTDAILARMKAMGANADPLNAADFVYKNTQTAGIPIKWGDVRDALSNINQKLTRVEGSGHMYEVGINANPDHFLDWDKPLSQQHPVVQDALQNLHPDALGLTPEKIRRTGEYQYITPLPGDRVFGSNVQQPVTSVADLLGDKNGRDLYDAFRSFGGGAQVDATQALQQAGIPGIKYLDGNSRGAGQGSHNYVVFDDNTIDILKKYGIAGLGLGGAAATQGGDPTQSDPTQ